MVSQVLASVPERLAAVVERWPEIEPQLRRLQEKRWRQLGHSLIAGVLSVAAVLAVAVAADAKFSADGDLFVALLPVGAALGIIVAIVGGWKADRQSAVAGRILRIHTTRALGLVYRHAAGTFPLERFASNGVLPEFDRAHLEDLVYGEVSGVPIIFCDATLDAEIQKSHLTVFRGPLVLSRFPKLAHGRTLVVPDSGSVGNFFWGMGEEHRRRVRMESPDFERVFAVYSTDQVEARCLLTPTVMERLLALRRRFSGRITVGFSGHEFMLTLDDRRDWFPDPGLFQDLTDPALIREQAEEIARIAEIVEILKLNLDTRA